MANEFVKISEVAQRYALAGAHDNMQAYRSGSCRDDQMTLMTADTLRILWNRTQGPSRLQRAQAIAAEVRARRGMVVRKGSYVEPGK